MKTIEVTVRHTDGRSVDSSIDVVRIANCGLAGRTPPPEDVLDKYEKKWKDLGVDRTETLPYIFPKPSHLITTDSVIEVNTDRTAGEVEFVLFPTDETTYVGVGFDHKDRDVANKWMHPGNSTCPSVVSNDVWVVDEIIDHWDKLRIRSWTGSGSDWEAFQSGPLADVLPPDELIDRIDGKIEHSVGGTSIWSGTFGTEQGEVNPFPKMKFGDFYAGELYDPVLNRRLFTRYDIKTPEWVEETSVS